MAKAVWTNSTPAGIRSVTIAPDADDFLIGYCFFDNPGRTVDVPVDWAQIGTTQSTSTATFAVFYKWAVGNETSVNFSCSQGNDCIGGVLSYANINVDNPFDVTPSVTSSSTGSTTIDSSLTPATDNTTLVHVYGFDGDGSNPTFTASTTSGTTASWTPLADQGINFFHVGASDSAQATAGAITVRCTTNLTGGHQAALIVLRASGAFYPEGLSESVTANESATGNIGAGSVGLFDNVAVAEHGGVTAPFCQRNFVQNDFGQLFPPSGGGATYTEGVNETGSVSDSLGAQGNASAGVSDSHAATDSFGAVRTGNAGLSDVTAVEDGTVTGQRTAFGTAGETVSDADGIGTTATAIQAINDSVGVVEALASQGKSIQEIVESTGITESQTIGILISAALAEAVSKSDDLGAVKKAIQALSEATATDENVATGGSTAHTIGLSDSGGVAAALSAAYSVVQTVTDSHGLTEAQAEKLTSTLGLAESIVKSEGFTGTLQIALALAEAVASVESLLASKVTAQALADSLAITEQQAAGILLAAVLAEAVAHSDGIASVVTALVGLNESGSLGDGISVGGSTSYTETLAESTGLTEGAVAALQSVAGLTDSGSIAESVASARICVAAVSEQSNLTETQTTRIAALLSIVDQLVGYDGVSAASALIESVLEQLNGAESSVIQARGNAELSDSLDVTAVVGALEAAKAGLDDGIQIVEEARASHTQALGLADAMLLADAAQAVRWVYASLAESTSVEEQASASGGTEYATGIIISFAVSSTDPNLILFSSATDPCLDFLAVQTDAFLVLPTNRA